MNTILVKANKDDLLKNVGLLGIKKPKRNAKLRWKKQRHEPLNVIAKLANKIALNISQDLKNPIKT